MHTSSLHLGWLHRSALMLCMLSAGCAIAQHEAPPRATPASMLTRYAQMPVRLCVDTDAASLAALRDGRQRLVLHMQQRLAATHYSPTFSVALVDLAGARTIEMERFSLHADRAEHDAAPSPQHFSFSLHGLLPPSQQPGALCVEIGVDLSDADSEKLMDSEVMLSATLEPVASSR